MSGVTPLSELPTLTLLYKLHKLSPASSPTSNATSKYNDKISLIRTDITKLEVDAIVNAANESLLGGGGVDGAIHNAAGPGLLEECEKLDGCDTGSAKITDAYRLPCKKVIHAVGPVYYATKREGMHTRLLQGCYTTSLDLAVANQCRSIAFSALSTGIYGYPSREAAQTAIQAVKGWLEKDEERAQRLDRVVFCQFMQKDEDAYEHYIPKYFPPAVSADGAHESKHPDSATRSAEAPAQAQTRQPEQVPNLRSEPETVPDLPDVPTKEPAEAGEPETKKLKLDNDPKP